MVLAEPGGSPQNLKSRLMPIGQEKLRELLKGKTRRVGLPEAKRQEQRINLHTEVAVDGRTPRNAELFLRMVKDILPADKYSMFLSLFKAPIPTNRVTSEIFELLDKVWEGQNPVYSYGFVNQSLEADFLRFMSDGEVLSKWRSISKEMMRTSINSVIVVDAKPTLDDGRAVPYFYQVDCSDVVDYQLSDDGVCFDWIAYNADGGAFVVMDDAIIRTYKKVEHEAKLVLLGEVSHSLGCCPARFFWSDAISPNTPEVKRSPISKVLTALDFLLFYMVSNEHLNLYARYPIFVVMASDCDYVHSDDVRCRDGFLYDTTRSEYLRDYAGGNLSECPVCSTKRLNGPGSEVEYDPPSIDNDNADLSDPVKVISIDRTTLEYNNEDIDSRARSLVRECTGFDGGPINNQAINESQVLAMFESLESSLSFVQSNIERVIKWSLKIMAQWRYGTGSIRTVNVSLGTKHYILSSTQILDMYAKAKAAGASDAVLTLLQDQYYETEFRNNPDMLNRMKMLSLIDGFRHRTKEDLQFMLSNSLISPTAYLVKSNFQSLVDRFERENAPVTDFGQILEMSERIKRIREALDAYARELLPNT